MLLVSPSVIGTARIPRELFLLKLGMDAFTRWSFLCRVRDYQGRCHPSLKGIARPKGTEAISEDKTQRALTRLRTAGLVEDIGYRVHQDYPGGPYFRVYWRKVFGLLVVDEVMVPIDVFPKVMRLENAGSKWGGKRANSGPKKVQDAVEQTGQKFHRILNPQPIQDAVLLGSRCGAERVQDAVPIITLISNLTHDSSAFLLPSEEEAFSKKPENAVLFSSSNSAQEGAMKTPKTNPPAEASEAPQDAPFEIPYGGTGDSRGKEDPVEVMAAMKELLDVMSTYNGKGCGPIMAGQRGLPHPPPPEATFVKLFGPPKFPAFGDTHDKLAFFAKWYRAALESRGLRVHPIKMAGVTRGYFEDALGVFEREGIRPGAFVAWAADRVLSAMPPAARKRYVPSVKQLLNPDLYTKTLWAFRDMEATYCMPRMVRSAAGRVFADRHAAMMAEIFVTDGTEEAITQQVRKHWPEGFDAAVDAVTLETEGERRTMVERVKAGEWLWPIPRLAQAQDKRSVVG